jgi:cell wall assembly regulator SMI1
VNKEIEKLWERIESWDIAHRDPTLGSYLNNSASEDAVSDLNRRLGGILPTDLLDSLRRHDGSVDWTTKFCQGRLLGASLILQRLQERRGIAQDLLDAERRNRVGVGVSLTPSGPVKSVFWSNHWIPFHETDWSVTCFDFDPPPNGVLGQIIEVDWEGGWIKVVATNYVDFLRLCADHLPDEPTE